MGNEVWAVCPHHLDTIGGELGVQVRLWVGVGAVLGLGAGLGLGLLRLEWGMGSSRLLITELGAGLGRLAGLGVGVVLV